MKHRGMLRVQLIRECAIKIEEYKGRKRLRYLPSLTGCAAILLQPRPWLGGWAVMKCGCHSRANIRVKSLI